MRPLLALVPFLITGMAGFTQTPAAAAKPGETKDPRAILAAAEPYYDFADPLLKPFHLKGTYQLYDNKGNPSAQGTFEYWRASPKVHRSTWTRADASYTDWHTADGKLAYDSTGEGPGYFEYRLESAFVSPLPAADSLDPKKVRLERQDVKVGTAKLPCVEVIPVMPQHGQLQEVPLGLFPTYCFDPKVPALRVSYSFGNLAEEFNSITEVQGRYLPREVVFFEGQRRILTAKLESVDTLIPSDPALTPDPQAKHPTVEKVQVPAGMIAGRLIKSKQVPPIYPLDAKFAHISGKVVLGAMIGRDGRIHDLHVIEAPWPSLVASAMWAVSQWQYRPYLLNGEPVDVDTTINVIYTLN